jgi:hypothetical protein
MIEVNGGRGFNPIEWGGYDSMTNKGTGAGVYCHETRRYLGQYTTVFQAEVYGIKECAAENLDGNYNNRNIYILSDRQAAIKALGKYQIT